MNATTFALQCHRPKPNTAAEKQKNAKRRQDERRRRWRTLGGTSPDSGARWPTGSTEVPFKSGAATRGNGSPLCSEPNPGFGGYGGHTDKASNRITDPPQSRFRPWWNFWWRDNVSRETGWGSTSVSGSDGKPKGPSYKPIACPKCGAAAELVGREKYPAFKGEIRIFQCKTCGKRSEVIVTDQL